jgi:hypothetical protein
MTIAPESEKPGIWIGMVCVVGPNFVAAHNLEREGWVACDDLGPTEYEGVFFCKKFKTPTEAVHQAKAIAERLGVMAASEAIAAGKVMDADDLPDP